MKMFWLVGICVVGIILWHFLKHKAKRNDINMSYLSVMQNLSKDEFLTTIGNVGFFASDKNLIISSYLYVEDKNAWNGKEVILINISSALPIENHQVFFERLKNNVDMWKGEALCTWRYGKADAYFELDIRIPLELVVDQSLSDLYKNIISFLVDDCCLSDVVRYVKQQIDEDIYYYEFTGMYLNRMASYIAVDNEWSSDMEDVHDTLADMETNNSEFITSDEFEEAYRNVE